MTCVSKVLKATKVVKKVEERGNESKKEEEILSLKVVWRKMQI